MPGGYEFGGKHIGNSNVTDVTYTESKVRTLVFKIKDETYSVKVQPMERIERSGKSDALEIPITITNNNMKHDYVVYAKYENNVNDSTEKLYEIFKEEIMNAVKEFIREKKRRQVIDGFYKKLDAFTLTDDDFAVEEL